ncbi:uncharacterized protein LOC119069266 [Bradysia coprophila]|uniref:uncharacterized protein LOC119069266 n=1 Tax=Bradysia coprophila TaxID=38358 RepID=UPI00187DAAEF|nr:uncharacterized protein LOC119069266 [Bradysia coprophila]
MAKIIIFAFGFLCACTVAFSSKVSAPHTALKRSFGAYEFPGLGSDYQNLGLHKFETFPLAPWNGHRSVLSPIEVANAVAAAKQASQNVLIAQQQVQVAKEHVLNQQRLAAEKETHATIVTQKKAAESAAAAQSVALAQQRLAAAKNSVAHQQRIAAAKEAHAVAALQNSPNNVAYAEVQRTDNEAARIAAAIHRSGAHFKDTIVEPFSVPLQHYSIAPWHNPLSASVDGAWSSPLYTTPSFKPAFNAWG